MVRPKLAKLRDVAVTVSGNVQVRAALSAANHLDVSGRAVGVPFRFLCVSVGGVDQPAQQGFNLFSFCVVH